MVKKDTWTKVKVGSNKPQFFLINKNDKHNPTQSDVNNISVSYTDNNKQVLSINNRGFPGGGAESYQYYTITPEYKLRVPAYDFEITYTNNSIPKTLGRYWPSQQAWRDYYVKGDVLALDARTPF